MASKTQRHLDNAISAAHEALDNVCPNGNFYAENDSDKRCHCMVAFNSKKEQNVINFLKTAGIGQSLKVPPEPDGSWDVCHMVTDDDIIPNVKRISYRKAIVTAFYDYFIRNGFDVRLVIVDF